MSPVEALELALSKEIEARDLYQKLADDYPGIKDTFFFLMNEEQKHKQLIEKKITELTR